MIQRRPYPSLRHVASALYVGYRFSAVLRTFLTYVDAENIEASIGQEPPRLAGLCPRGAYFDAYLAAVGEFEAERFGVPSPEWVHGEGRVLSAPSSPTNGREALHQILMSETPAAFKKRGLVISSNALDVA